MRLIGLAGRAGSGKDTAGEYLAKNYMMEHTFFAKPIKEGCRVMFGLTDEQLYGSQKETVIPEYGCSPRQIMQWAGTEFGRNLVHPDIWLMRVRHVWDAIQATADETFHGGLVVTDVRFENEAALIRELGGTVVHVVRDRTPDVADHSSEAGIEFKLGDIRCDNTGTKHELYAALDTIVLRIDKVGT
jgi:hypothetical protein